MRYSGVLLPVFSLPGKYGIGSFSKEAYRFVDFLKGAGQSLWQILPLGPTSFGDSPYQSYSTFAGNPYLIDLESLIDEGVLRQEDADRADFGDDPDHVDYVKQESARMALLRTAYESAKGSLAGDTAYQAFCTENASWLDDYALFMALKDRFGGASFDTWDEDIRLRQPAAMQRYSAELSDSTGFYKYIQYVFDRQWKQLKSYANAEGVRIVGDMPIYVSADSADAWANPRLFQFDENQRPTGVAGCPPDAFSETGQLWGNPLYDWDYHRSTGFDWWKKRMAKAAELYDIVRIDHFRGFDEYYAIPAGAENAVHGTWEKGPGMDLFNALKPVLAANHTGIIAEDLGFITDTVRKLVKDSGFPNMKVLEFAFGDPDSTKPNEYLPFMYQRNCIAYTGTHDNETLVGWLKNQTLDTVNYVREIAGTDSLTPERIAWAMVRLVMFSPADYCVIPLQDWLGLDNRARINTPSTVGGNWNFRFRSGAATEALAEQMHHMTKLSGRIVPEDQDAGSDN